METRKLHHAVTLGRLLNFTRAAEQLNLTQSALSRSIQSLEAECGLKLFDRGRGAVALTQAGREFVRHAEVLLRSEVALSNFAQHASKGQGGHIALGVTPFVAHVLLAPVLSTRIGQPQFQADVKVGSTRQLLRHLSQEDIDLAIGSDLIEGNPAFSFVTLARFLSAMIVRRGHPLTRLDHVTDKDTEEYPLLRPTSLSSDEVLPALAGQPRPGSPAVTIEDYGVLEQIVRMSDAIWVTSPIAARRGIDSGDLVQIQLDWIAQTNISIVAYSLSQRTLSPLANSILEQFKSVGAEISEAT